MNCQLHIPEVEGLVSQQISVGRYFYFNCEGSWPEGFDTQKAQVVPGGSPYEFVLKGIENTSVKFVSYTAGEFPAQALKITDGQQIVDLNFSGVKVESILPTPPPQEPYGFITLRLAWPWEYTVFFIIIFVALFGMMIRQFNNKRRLRRLLSQLEDYNSALAADSQFYKHIRLLEKQNYPVQDIEKQFRIYVIRKYQVPLFGMNLNEAMSYLKKKWPTYVNERRDLKNILLDLNRMKEKADPTEIKKYLKKLYQFVDHSEQKMENRL